MIMRRLLCLGLVAVSLSGLSCQRLSRRNYNVDKVSPNGVYRVKVEVRVEDEDTLMGGFNEWGKVQFFKGQEVIDTNEWQRKDNFEPTFIDAHPNIEWIGDNVLRMGGDRPDEHHAAGLIISNNTAEPLRYIGVSCSKYESFEVFDIAPGSQIMFVIAPTFQPDELSTYALGYGGETQSGKKFEGVTAQGQRRSPADDSLTFQIAVNAKDLR